MVVASVGRHRCGHVEMSRHPHVGHVGVGVGVGVGDDDDGVGVGVGDDDDGVGVGVVRVGVGGCVSATMPGPMPR